MSFEIIPAHDIPLAVQARVFTDAFSGYAGGSFAMDAAGLARFLCPQGADLCHSRFARNADGLCGFGYVTRIGDVARLAGMGVVPAARRSGVARGLLAHLLEEASARGDRTMVLEVIEQNPAAVALYRGADFYEVTRLLGWRRAAAPTPGGAAIGALREISLVAASQFPIAREFPDLPWAISRHALAKMSAGRAYSSGAALIVTGDPDVPGPLRVHGFASLVPGKANWPEIRKIFLAVLQRYPDREFFAPPVFPEDFGIFAELGFQREPINQFLLRRDLCDAPTGPGRSFVRRTA